ncbi:MAG: hypothetical protein IPN72_06925 [Saprospiraceae bacterium]|nr:hypothetical protein [Saprospiraceae bacterium]
MLCWDKDGFALYSKRLASWSFGDFARSDTIPKSGIAYQHFGHVDEWNKLGWFTTKHVTC